MVSRQFPRAVWLVSRHIWTVSGPCLDYIWNIKHVWRVSGPVWNVSGCVWMCMEHVWTVSRLCLEHVHTFCGPCSEHVWTVTVPWCPCLDHGLCMCMDQFGPCLDIVVTVYGLCLNLVYTVSECVFKLSKASLDLVYKPNCVTSNKPWSQNSPQQMYPLEVVLMT